MSSIIPNTVSQLHVAAECCRSGTSCMHECQITFSNGRKVSKCLSGDAISALMQVAQSNIARTRNNHFSQYSGLTPNAALASLVPESNADDLRAKVREMFPRNEFFAEDVEKDIAKGILKDPSSYIKLLIEKRGNTQNFTPFDIYLNFLKNYFTEEFLSH